MKNPFELIEARLNSIETLILDLKHQATQPAESSDLRRPMTIQEASAFLNLTVPTLYSKVSKGELPVMKRGKRLYFSQPDLLDYLKQGRRKTFADIQAEAVAYLTNKK
jgi:excisionase family DNA binding protein